MYFFLGASPLEGGILLDRGGVMVVVGDCNGLLPDSETLVLLSSVMDGDRVLLSSEPLARLLLPDEEDRLARACSL